MLFLRKRACPLYLLISLIITGYGLTCKQSIANELPLNIVVNTQCKDNKLGKILEKVAEQNGCRIRVDDDLSDILVTGVFVSVSLDNFLRRALKKENYSLIIDQQNQEVRVFSPGKNIKKISKFSDIKNPLDPRGSNEQAVQIREKQEKYLKIADNNPDYRGSISGKTLFEIKEIHRKQEGFAQEYQKDSEAVEPVTGIPFADIRSTQEKQERELHLISMDPDAIIPGIGLTRGVLEAIHSRQNAVLENMKKMFTGHR